MASIDSVRRIFVDREEWMAEFFRDREETVRAKTK